jgi:hypothetical protein
MATPASFPRDLLKEGAAARLAHFRRYTVAHMRLQQLDRVLWQAIHEPGDAALICVFGPTGVGKTTLRYRIQRLLAQELHPVLQDDPGRVASIAIEAVAPETGAYSWKDHYLAGLQALDDPFSTPVVGREQQGMWLRTARGPELRRSLEQALRHRRPTAVIIDEAQHLTKVASGRKLKDHLDHVKHLADASGVVHVLLGTYELLALRNLSAQLSRRSLDLHFARYDATAPEDVHAFKSTLQAFQWQLPLEETPDLLTRWATCYERTIGCVGVLKIWLTRALAVALDEGAATLTERHVIRCAPSLAQCTLMLDEAASGEQALRDDLDAGSHLRLRLGLTGGELPHTPAPAPHPTRIARAIGRRTPRRDPVGLTTRGVVR